MLSEGSTEVDTWPPRHYCPRLPLSGSRVSQSRAVGRENSVSTVQGPNSYYRGYRVIDFMVEEGLCGLIYWQQVNLP